MPLSDGMRPQRLPIVNALLIPANLAVWLFDELPQLDSSVADSSFYACSVNATCHPPAPLHPEAGIRTLVFIFVVCIRAWIFIGLWFGSQLVEGYYGLTAAHGHNDGTAFFAHIGGFVFGVIAAVVLVRAGKQQDVSAARGRLRLAT